MNRRTFIKGTAAAAALRWANRTWAAEHDFTAIRKQIEKRHGEAVCRLQDWIHQPSIAAENRAVSEGCDFTIRLLRQAGFARHDFRGGYDGRPFEMEAPILVARAWA